VELEFSEIRIHDPEYPSVSGRGNAAFPHPDGWDASISCGSG
jgi:hypothetical protein